MPDQRSRDILWRPSRRADLARYALAAVFVLGTAGAATFALHRLPDGQSAGEAEDAVILDLPPALASSAPPSEAADGPEQQASEAAPPAAPPREVAPEATPDDAPPEQPPQPQPDDPPPPDAVKPDAATPPPPAKPPDATTPPAVAAAPAQEEMAPAGSQAPVKDAAPIASEAARRRAAHALSRWQQAMLIRLEGAKSGARSGGERGTVTLAFTIDRSGRLVSSRVAQGSGSRRLDQAALALLGRAAPFPAPPAGSPDALSFTVPVAFARR